MPTPTSNDSTTHTPAAASSQVTVPNLETLRARGTMKWTVHPEDVLPLWVAESDFETCPAVNAAIHAAADRQYYGYEKRDGATQRALTGFLADRFGWEVPEGWVRLIPDVVKGVAVAIDELTPAGSDVIVPVPSYFPFFELPSAINRPKIEVEMTTRATGEQAEEWAFDLEALERAFASTDNPNGVGAMIVCNPYNPLGRAWRPEELEELVELADRYNVRLISDEIHAPIVYSPARHTPLAAVSEKAARISVTVTATSKGWNTAGLHCAQLILTNPEDRAVFDKVPALRSGAASTLGQVAAEAAYTHGREWLDNEVAYLENNLDLLERRLPEALPGARFIRPEASYLLWVDVREVPGLATQPGKKILERAKVAFNEGTIFGSQGEGHIRINFATSPDILNEVLDRLEQADFS
ncbi:MAG TPA: aminotransferase class I/II-fold pyridoxal phosphate-dependent enzyme [Candidatus Corynebacterium gallistercoris]|uniref:cysteine-S-conjugate beta-lyase n=1 Tax=Candidatus Corynebacterium gallistercoris TaxID=2838530 RepID=A0A9D1UQA6_9CORY|nr:aminotransferase class I/II-fold pyridoxal phosphate-dependent enzyme [Candidatus Corynebacterium gallistercoris]